MRYVRKKMVNTPATPSVVCVRNGFEKLPFLRRRVQLITLCMHLIRKKIFTLQQLEIQNTTNVARSYV